MNDLSSSSLVTCCQLELVWHGHYLKNLSQVISDVVFLMVSLLALTVALVMGAGMIVWKITVALAMLGFVTKTVVVAMTE